MKVLWLSWKDIHHPQSGGAETVNHELMKRLVSDGHQVTLLTSLPRRGAPGCALTETIDGVDIIHVGSNRYLHSLQAVWYYRKQLKNRFDLIIECVNTAPYFIRYFKGRERVILFYHQLAREIWFHETWFPLSLLGYAALEPVATWLQSRKTIPVITVSESTKKDLMRFGFKPENIHLISEGITLEPLPNPPVHRSLGKGGNILSLGAIRSMKRTHHILKAFEILKKCHPELVEGRLIIAGDASGSYGKKVLRMVGRSPFKQDIQLLGRVSREQKIELLQRAHVLAVTSVKEGWGLVVTEAASQGTPAVVYDVDGLRDSVKNGESGIVCRENTPQCLAKNIAELLQDIERYERLRRNAWELSKKINFEKSYEDFKNLVFPDY